jgi:ribose 5-phosphate isomerase B
LGANQVRQFLQNAGYLVDDPGTWSDESADYPNYGRAVGECVAAHKDVFGIAVCGTGIGISIVVNKVFGIRAAVAHDVSTARLAREHNDPNVLALGWRVVSGSQAIKMVQTFLSTAFVGGRHARRVEKIAIIEQDERKKN